MQRIILLAYYYLPHTTSGVQRAVRLAKYLPQYGYATSVICAGHAGLQPKLEDVLHVPNEVVQSPRWLVSLARMIQRILPYNEQLPWAVHAIAAARSVMAHGPVAAVVSTSPPLATHLAALFLKKRHGLVWVADFRDPLVGNPGRARAWAKPYDAALERWIFQSATAVVGVTDAVVDAWRQQYRRLAYKFHLIWNGFDPGDQFGPAQVPERPYRVLAHVGVLYVQRHPTAMLASLDRLVRQRLVDPARLRLRFVGPIQQQEELEGHLAAASLLAQGCLEIRPGVIPREQAMLETATADALLLIDIVNLSNTGYTVPAKIYDYILTGRPILALTDRDSPVDRILQRAGIRYACLYRDDIEAETDRKLATFLDLPNEPLAPSACFLENFDGERQAGRLAALLDALTLH